MRFQVSGEMGQVEVEAVDWMMAMSKAITHFGVQVSGWVCDTRPNGDTQVMDPGSGLRWVVHPLTEAPVATSAPTPAPRGGPPPVPSFLRGATAPKLATPPPAPPRAAQRAPAPPPAPVPPRDDGPPADLAERLFDVSMDISAAPDKNSACSAALQIALDLVSCEAGSVLRGTINDADLTFVAVSGPVGEKLLGRKVPFGQGLAGVAFDLGITVQVNDVSQDARHNKAVDRATGFVTRSILSVPVRTEVNFYGCLQLLNPPNRFLPWHVEVAETVARSLAATLAVTI